MISGIGFSRMTTPNFTATTWGHRFLRLLDFLELTLVAWPLAGHRWWIFLATLPALASVP